MAKVATRMPSRRDGGGDRVGYLRGVWDELKKVIWPTRTELWRMTGIVVATVIIFALLIGGADYALGLLVKPIYTVSNNTTNVTNTTTPANTAPTTGAIPTAAAAPTAAPPVSP